MLRGLVARSLNCAGSISRSAIFHHPHPFPVPITITVAVSSPFCSRLNPRPRPRPLAPSFHRSLYFSCSSSSSSSSSSPSSMSSDEPVITSGPTIVGTDHAPTGRVWERLPNTVIPKHYHLTLTPDMEKYEFKGTVVVDVDIKSEVSVVELNSAELVLQTATITTAQSSSPVSSVSIVSSASEEVSRITFPNKLPIGTAKLTITFTGILNDQMKGFYRSAYKSARTGKDTIMAVTQFEATDARRAFPCWDEPALKATFSVSLIIPSSATSSLTVVSNMPEISRTTANGLDTVIFDRSPIMSTYLLAFVIGEFDMIERRTENGILVRCFTPVGKTAQGEFGLDVAVRVLPFYEKYFDIPYPLPKLDLLAIPDFAAGAMENWGCVTYRESALLLDAHDSSAQTKQWVALVVAHEIAHQWFGNLVTMEWWTHLWLNEGFATWMENFAVDFLFPEWNIWSQYVSSDMNQALSLDALKNSHAIEVAVNHPDEVDEIFDAISYSKGSVVIRMLHAYLGAETFRKGLQAYLKKYTYQNALTQDLWRVLGEESGKPVSEFMEGWTRHTGFPLVRVNKRTQQDSSLVYQLRQDRFFVDGIDQKDDTVWRVPISCVYPGSVTGPAEMLADREGQVKLQLPSTTMPSYIKLNAGQVGLFRVMYTADGWKELEKAIESNTVLSATDRLGLQNDAFALTRAGEMSTVQLLQLVAAYEHETDYTVWSDLSMNLSDLGSVLKHAPDTTLYPLFQTYARKLFKHILGVVGWKSSSDESHIVTLLRAKILAQAAKYEDESTVLECIHRFQRYLVTNNDAERAALIPPDLRSTVYAVVCSHGGLLGYESLLSLHESCTLQEERVRILKSLGYTSDIKLVQRTLDMAMGPKVRSQDVPGMLLSVGRNLQGVELGWSFICSNWSLLVSRFGGSFAMSQIASFPSEFVTQQHAQQVEEFFKTHTAPAGERAAKQAIEKIRSNAAWLARDGAAIKQWLQQQQQQQ